MDRIAQTIVLTARSIKVTFRDHKGTDIKTIEGNEGDDLLSLAHEYDVDLEGKCLLQLERAFPLRRVQGGSAGGGEGMRVP